MTKVQPLPMTMEQVEVAIDGLTGRLVAMAAINRALIEHISTMHPGSIGQLRACLMLQTADHQEELQHASAESRHMFLLEVASANRLIDRLQDAQEGP